MWAKLRGILGISQKKTSSKGSFGHSSSDLDKRSMLSDMELGETDGYPMRAVHKKSVGNDGGDKQGMSGSIGHAGTESHSSTGKDHKGPSWARHDHHGEAQHSHAGGTHTNGTGASSQTAPFHAHTNNATASTRSAAPAGNVPNAASYMHASAPQQGGHKWGNQMMDDLLGEIDGI